MARLLSWGGCLVEVQGAARRAGAETRMASGHEVWAVTDDTHQRRINSLRDSIKTWVGGGGALQQHSPPEPTLVRERLFAKRGLVSSPPKHVPIHLHQAVR